MNPKPLIAVPSPREIPQVIEALNKVNKDYDIMWIKYMPEYQAYPLMRDKFLNHPTEKYTHLIIVPDDLLIDDVNKVRMLLEDYDEIKPSSRRDYTIMSGYCNVDHGTNGKFANITRSEVLPVRKGRVYNWVTLDELENKKKLISVKFAGFPLFVIPRTLVELVPFRNDSATGQFDAGGCCVDIMFCNDVLDIGGKIFVDPRVKLNHLKVSDKLSSQTVFQNIHSGNTSPHFFIEYSEKKLMVN